ncbi:hypothetical protein ANANG_G00091860 [Anguilla anguilla]|uniref:Uncharacterized protein n=1 Tax=Anguilla anguilla TaxID=7936 RepID=A0A9D3MMC0_ANGAN|nr:hypothetical protein ANANG_G00091860 [Anguilla anguilla]
MQAAVFEDRATPTGEEEPGSLAEVSYYSYEYDTEAVPFPPEGEEAFELAGEGAGRRRSRPPPPPPSRTHWTLSTRASDEPPPGLRREREGERTRARERERERSLNCTLLVNMMA